MQRILLIDNFDSFTYNLVQQIKSIQDCDVIVKRNDEMINPPRGGFDKLIISPGPKTPKDSGSSKSLIKELYKDIPILGVCLGMQCINEVFGGETTLAPLPVHGKKSIISHSQEGLFYGIPDNIEVARYHSLVIDKIPEELAVTAHTEDSIPMAIQHKNYPTYGVQFHPESFLTENGNQLMNNFLKIK